VAVVTGASGGIGRATAIELARNGADLVLQYRSKEREAKRLADEVEKLGSEVIVSRVDFLDARGAPYEVNEMIEATVKRFRRVDILVNLAGYPAKGEWNKKFLDLTSEDFFKPINVDLFGSFLCAQAVAPHMIKQRSGTIVNVSSTPALGGHDRGFAFTVAKAAVIGLTKAMAVELAPYVRVNTVALGNVETEWLGELSQKEREEGRQENLIKRFGKPEEVAKMITFLCSDDSSFVNGQTIVLDGGTLLH